MIISASRRTDIPAFYGEWMLNRLREGFVLVPNPHNPMQVSRVPLSPDVVDCIVFWTKNPAPMLPYLDELERMGYPFTLTSYGKAIECGLPDKEELARVFCKLSERLGAHCVVWRYDPVLLHGEITERYHLEQFQRLCAWLEGRTEACIFSFLDIYPGKAGFRGEDAFRPVPWEAQERLAAAFAETARTHGIKLKACAETGDFSKYGVERAACIDAALVSRVVGEPLRVKKAAGQRPECGCAESVDIGMYDTCPNGCTYCYAVAGEKALYRRLATHSPNAPMLAGEPPSGAVIKPRVLKSAQVEQFSLFQ